MKNCIFCKIIKEKINEGFVYKDDDLVVLNDINPIAPVHLLIIPKKHIEGIQTVEKEDERVLGKMLLIARKMAEKKKLQGYKLFFNCGKLGGQEIFHLHLHLISGWKNRKEFHELVKRRLVKGGVL